MTPSNVLLIKGDYDRAGGPETLLSLILKNIDRDRYAPSLVVLRKSEGNGAEILSNGDGRIEIPWPGLLRARRVSGEISDLARRVNASVIHTHDMRSNLAGYLLGRSRRVPWIAHVHGWLGATHRGKFRIYEKVDQHIIRRADAVLVGSEAARKEVASLGVRRVELVHNAVEIPDAFPSPDATRALRDSLDIPRQSVVVGVVGRVHPGKGQLYLIRAMRRLLARESTLQSNLHLLIVGDGPDLPAARELARETGIEKHVTFTGYHPDATALIDIMDIVVVPSLKESLPLTALEAMARRRCVIASRVGDLPRLISDGVNGRLVTPADEDQLASAIEDLSIRPDLRAQAGDAARQTIVEQFSARAMVRKLENIYCQFARKELSPG